MSLTYSGNAYNDSNNSRTVLVSSSNQYGELNFLTTPPDSFMARNLLNLQSSNSIITYSYGDSSNRYKYTISNNKVSYAYNNCNFGTSNITLSYTTSNEIAIKGQIDTNTLYINKNLVMTQAYSNCDFDDGYFQITASNPPASSNSLSNLVTTQYETITPIFAFNTPVEFLNTVKVTGNLINSNMSWLSNNKYDKTGGNISSNVSIGTTNQIILNPTGNSYIMNTLGIGKSNNISSAYGIDMENKAALMWNCVLTGSLQSTWFDGFWWAINSYYSGGNWLRRTPTSGGFVVSTTDATGVNFMTVYKTAVSNASPIARMTINTSNGYIGINDTTPAYNLDVGGTINATGNITSPTITALSNLGMLGCNLAVSTSNYSYSNITGHSNIIYPVLTANTSNITGNSNLIYPVLTANTSNITGHSNLIYPVLAYSSNTASWSSNNITTINYSSNALSNYVLTSNANATYAPSNTLSNYLRLTGGTITGNLKTSGATTTVTLDATDNASGGSTCGLYLRNNWGRERGIYFVSLNDSNTMWQIGARYVGGGANTRMIFYNSNSVPVISCLQSAQVGINKLDPTSTLDVAGTITSCNITTTTTLTASNLTACNILENAVALTSKYALSNTLSNYALQTSLASVSNLLNNYVLLSTSNSSNPSIGATAPIQSIYISQDGSSSPFGGIGGLFLGAAAGAVTSVLMNGISVNGQSLQSWGEQGVQALQNWGTNTIMDFVNQYIKGYTRWETANGLKVIETLGTGVNEATTLSTNFLKSAGGKSVVFTEGSGLLEKATVFSDYMKIGAKSVWINGDSNFIAITSWSSNLVASNWTSNLNSNVYISDTTNFFMSNVGIGKNNPAYTLDVNGTINASGNITSPTITALSNLGMWGCNSLSNYTITSTANTRYAPSNTLSNYVLTSTANTTYAPSNTLSNYLLTATGNTTYAPSNTLSNYLLTATGNTNYAPSNTLSNYILTATANTRYAPSNTYILTATANTTYAPSNTFSNLIFYSSNTATWSSNAIATAVWSSNNALNTAGGTISGALTVNGSTTLSNVLVRHMSRLWFYGLTDLNHCVYQNFQNQDGEGAFNGIKWNVYNGLWLRTGNTTGSNAPPLTCLYATSNRLAIGKTNPTEALDVVGNATISGNIITPKMSNYMSINDTAFTGTDAVFSIKNTDPKKYNNMRFVSDNTNVWFGLDGSSNGTASNQFYLWADSFIPMRFGVGGQERMRISNTGNICLGNPSSVSGYDKIHIKDGGIYQEQIAQYNYNGITFDNKWAGQYCSISAANEQYMRIASYNSNLTVKRPVYVDCSTFQVSGKYVTPIKMDNAIVNRKIVLYEQADNDYEYSGMGINPFVFRFNIPNTTNMYQWNVATSSTASTQLMRLQGNGLTVIGGDFASPWHQLLVHSPNNIYAFACLGGTSPVFQVYTHPLSLVTPNNANAMVTVGSEVFTYRSINAAGSINANSSDYAEYMEKSSLDFKIDKGDICGINKDGKLTNKWSESIHFMVKSTNPAYVGGDIWGCGEEYQVKPDDDEKTKKMKEDKLEEKRQWVDRIAFCGQVPVNIKDFNIGDYIVPMKKGNDGIEAVAVPEDVMNFSEYKRSVGKVIKKLEDGRAYCIVKCI